MALLKFLARTPLRSLTLPMGIFKLIWQRRSIRFFKIMDIEKIVIEDMENMSIFRWFGLFMLHPNMSRNSNTTEISFTYKPQETLSLRGFILLLAWLDLGFSHIKRLSINVSNWESLLPVLQSREGWRFSMHLLEELIVGGQKAKLIHIWQVNNKVYKLSKLANQTNLGNIVYLIPLANYGNWVCRDIEHSLDAARMSLLNNEQEREEFVCPVCLNSEHDWGVENKAPVVGMFVCGHVLCFECVSTMIKLDPRLNECSGIRCTICPLCKMVITPQTVAFLRQKPKERIGFVGAPIDAQLLTNYYIKKYVLIGLEYRGYLGATRLLSCPDKE
ncbi:hypothetical protein NEDG_00195 [Nematocida displodere]|uniref:RING-type domain-containing protein n=1 Tax=Nematocida displodere TaxID=1805483 RepID=A0A177EK20_9MICR|nr:hypothetical protein NEDG_00195 [Nematocida displodere]